jgi:Mor family transcriptional regulator
MSTLAEVLPFLEQGHIVQNARGESLRPLTGGRVEYFRARGYYFEAETVTLAEVRNMRDVWDWSVVDAPREERA